MVGLRPEAWNSFHLVALSCSVVKQEAVHRGWEYLLLLRNAVRFCGVSIKQGEFSNIKFTHAFKTKKKTVRLVFLLVLHPFITAVFTYFRF